MVSSPGQMDCMVNTVNDEILRNVEKRVELVLCLFSSYPFYVCEYAFFFFFTEPNILI